LPSDVRSAILERVPTPFALYAGVIAGSIVLVVIALHVYASWTIRNIDRSDTL
jgi:hypothetical protein